MNLEQLRHIVALARSKSYARAARELNLSQPVLSRSIQAIEQRYGCRLFDRGRFGASLTPEGASILEEAEEILRRTDVLRHVMTRLKQGDGGEVSFGISSVVETLILPQLLTTLVNQRPSIRVKVRTQPATLLLQVLVAEEIEFFLCGDLGLATHADVIVERIGQMRTGLFVRRGHPLASVEKISSDELAKYPRIGPSPSAQVPQYHPTIACDNNAVLMQVAKKSDSIWSTYSGFCEDDELVQLDQSLTVVDSTSLSLITLPHRHLSSQASYTVSCLRKILSDLGIAV